MIRAWPRNTLTDWPRGLLASTQLLGRVRPLAANKFEQNRPHPSLATKAFDFVPRELISKEFVSILWVSGDSRAKSECWTRVKWGAEQVEGTTWRFGFLALSPHRCAFMAKITRKNFNRKKNVRWFQWTNTKMMWLYNGRNFECWIYKACM